jgi:hypothetical protein
LLQCLQEPTCRRHQSPLLEPTQEITFAGTNLQETPIPLTEHQLSSSCRHQPTTVIFTGTHLQGTPIPLVENQLSRACRYQFYWKHQTPQVVNNTILSLSFKPSLTQVFSLSLLSQFSICIVPKVPLSLHLPATLTLSSFHSLSSSDLRASELLFTQSTLTRTSHSSILSPFLYTLELDSSIISYTKHTPKGFPHIQKFFHGSAPYPFESP